MLSSLSLNPESRYNPNLIGNERKLHYVTTSLILNSNVKNSPWGKKKDQSTFEEMNRIFKNLIPSSVID